MIEPNTDGIRIIIMSCMGICIGMLSFSSVAGTSDILHNVGILATV